MEHPAAATRTSTSPPPSPPPCSSWPRSSGEDQGPRRAVAWVVRPALRARRAARSPPPRRPGEVLGFEATTSLDEMLDEVIPWIRRPWPPGRSDDRDGHDPGAHRHLACPHRRRRAGLADGHDRPVGARCGARSGVRARRRAGGAPASDGHPRGRHALRRGRPDLSRTGLRAGHPGHAARAVGRVQPPAAAAAHCRGRGAARALGRGVDGDRSRAADQRAGAGHVPGAAAA